MSKFLFVSFGKNSFLVSDGESPMKNFEIYNFEDCTQSLTHVNVYDKKTGRTRKILVSKHLEESNYRNIPFIPVFQSFINNMDINTKNFRHFVKEKFAFRFFKRNILAVIPDDSIAIDKRCINDFFLSCGLIKKVFLANTGLLISKGDGEPYCALTKSARTVTLSLVIDGGFIDKIFLTNEHNDSAQIKSLINAWRNQFKIPNPPILLYGENMELFSQLGTMVTDDVLLENMKKIESRLLPKGFNVFYEPLKG